MQREKFNMLSEMNNDTEDEKRQGILIFPAHNGETRQQQLKPSSTLLYDCNCKQAFKLFNIQLQQKDTHPDRRLGYGSLRSTRQ